MSKLKLLSSVAVAALIAMPAFAQTSSPSASPPASRSTTSDGAATSRPSLPSDIKMWKVSDLVGKNVYNSSNEKVGDVNDVVVPKSGGGQTMAVLGVGGFLGIGEKEAAVSLDQLKVEGDKIIVAGLTKESLKQQADYKKDDYTKVDRNQVVGQASGTTGSTSGSGTTGSSSTTGSSPSPGSSSSGMSSPSGSSATPPSTSGSSGSGSSTGSSGSSSTSGSSSGAPGSGSTSGSSGSMGSTGSSTSPSAAPPANNAPSSGGSSTQTPKQ